ncbi:hypothetical protein JX265_008674 [Neoarthrinium moseri]|uniref:RRM domain-containing protein n=1 Tax=Neoarthrinium moseri TaxID=1658444 RepID=A0A9Q0AM44_9PEZI|nr:uncharacterized protein JN550_013541 [Neoarthrinium moseri]KAI1849262.1 hypothetical protein JX266_005223 [Neoarthrinium moseri]KAI1856975.1 hypothetical protein JN550_013541 [Neoarthrinium moseri]KAI1864303.1 hypothetical protein JX265_008674 [Neoarthrinium moseri]
MQFPKAAARPSARFFTQTVRAMAQDSRDPHEQAFEQAIAADAVESAERLGSTAPAEEGSLTSSPLEGKVLSADPVKIFVSNIAFDATDMHLREAFSKYGEILAVNIGRDGRGLSKGFAFVTFGDKAAADQAVTECHRSFWHGRRINVDHARPETKRSYERAPEGSRTKNEPSSSLYIGNIPYETSDADLNNMFRDLDKVVDVRVAVDRNTGWPRGFAHADFADVESAIKGYEKITGATLGGRVLRVDYSQPRSPPREGRENREGRRPYRRSQTPREQ